MRLPWAAPPKVHAAWPGGEYAPLDAVLECAVPPKVPFALVLTLAAVARALCRRGPLSGRRRGCARWSLSRWHGRVDRRFRAFMARGSSTGGTRASTRLEATSFGSGTVSPGASFAAAADVTGATVSAFRVGTSLWQAGSAATQAKSASEAKLGVAPTRRP